MTDRAFMKGWKRAPIVAVLAYALVLQALAFAFGGALHAGAANLPQAVFCESGDLSAHGDSPSKAHDTLCCIVSCHASGSLSGPVPVVASFGPMLPILETVGLSHPRPVLRLASNVLPVGSRAPPRLG